MDQPPSLPACGCGILNGMQREAIEGAITELGMGEIEVVRALFLDIFTGEPWNDVWPEDRLRDYLSELLGAPRGKRWWAWR